MSQHIITPGNSFAFNADKDNYLLAQEKVFFKFLKENCCTASMAAEALGVPQKNLTRYKRELEKAGLLKEVKQDYCRITGRKAWYITCNPTLFPHRRQLRLFD